MRAECKARGGFVPLVPRCGTGSCEHILYYGQHSRAGSIVANTGEFVAAPFRVAFDFAERRCHAKARRYETRKMPARTPALLFWEALGRRQGGI